MIDHVSGPSLMVHVLCRQGNVEVSIDRGCEVAGCDGTFANGTPIFFGGQ